MDGLVWRTEKWPVERLKPWHKNPRKIEPEALERLKESILQDGYHAPILVDADGTIAAGHQRYKALCSLGHKEVDVRVPSRQLTATEFDRINIRDNVPVGTWDIEALKDGFDLGFLEEMGLDLGAIGLLGGDNEKKAAADGEGGEKGSLAAKFGVPPFTVLDGRQGYWQERKRGWLGRGIESEKGREELEATVVQTDWMQRGNDSGGSVFDPVLCELAYTWFSPKGGVVLDPFAGGSVRGVVASLLGRQYVGCELRGEQVAANRVQGEAICAEMEHMPVWHQGDSAHIDRHAAGTQADLVFSCPPYADLEVYSKDPADISNMPYAEFLAAYRTIIAKSCALLKPDRFAVWVIGEVRGPDGAYRNFVGDTVQAFLDAGMAFYNEAVFITPVGSLPMRVARQFPIGRKLGKGHQNVLVFVKGDGKRAAAACGTVEVFMPEEGADGQPMPENNP